MLLQLLVHDQLLEGYHYAAVSLVTCSQDAISRLSEFMYELTREVLKLGLFRQRRPSRQTCFLLHHGLEHHSQLLEAMPTSLLQVLEGHLRGE